MVLFLLPRCHGALPAPPAAMVLFLLSPLPWCSSCSPAAMVLFLLRVLARPPVGAVATPAAPLLQY